MPGPELLNMQAHAPAQAILLPEPAPAQAAAAQSAQAERNRQLARGADAALDIGALDARLAQHAENEDELPLFQHSAELSAEQKVEALARMPGKSTAEIQGANARSVMRDMKSWLTGQAKWEALAPAVRAVRGGRAALIPMDGGIIGQAGQVLLGGEAGRLEAEGDGPRRQAGQSPATVGRGHGRQPVQQNGDSNAAVARAAVPCRLARECPRRFGRAPRRRTPPGRRRAEQRCERRGRGRPTIAARGAGRTLGERVRSVASHTDRAGGVGSGAGHSRIRPSTRGRSAHRGAPRLSSAARRCYRSDP